MTCSTYGVPSTSVALATTSFCSPSGVTCASPPSSRPSTICFPLTDQHKLVANFPLGAFNSAPHWPDCKLKVTAVPARGLLLCGVPYKATHSSGRSEGFGANSSSLRPVEGGWRIVLGAESPCIRFTISQTAILPLANPATNFFSWSATLKKITFECNDVL
jgi:hypothetical protein